MNVQLERVKAAVHKYFVWLNEYHYFDELCSQFYCDYDLNVHILS